MISFLENEFFSKVMRFLGMEPSEKVLQHDIQRSSISLIAIGAALWWLLLAVCSKIPLSKLQLTWSLESYIVLWLFCPICILSGLAANSSCSPVVPTEIRDEEIYPRSSRIVFYLCVMGFLIQSLFRLPPALAPDPNEARLLWGFKYLHVSTEILIRTTVLICLGNVLSRGKVRLHDWVQVSIAMLYTILVVSRSFLLEIFFYVGLTSFLLSFRLEKKALILVKVAAGLIAVIVLFVVYGEWRQGSSFNISSYGQMLNQSRSVAWIFGYLLVNFDNLALIIMDSYKNYSLTNVFGPLLQTLQITPFQSLNDYPYVGAFNLGTALRSYFLDFGPWIGAAIFAVFWTSTLALFRFSRSKSVLGSLFLLVAYFAFCLPITERLEQPPYLFPLLLIFLIGRLALVKNVKFR